jgi:hypothetical protein
MATVIQAVEAYNNTLASLSIDGEWLTVRTLKAPEKIMDVAEMFGFSLSTWTLIVRGIAPSTQ